MMRTLPGLFLSCLILTGCLERRETLTVARDGSLTMEATFEGPLAEFNGAALLPSREGGWAVEQQEREKTAALANARRVTTPNARCGPGNALRPTNGPTPLRAARMPRWPCVSRRN